MCSTRYRCLIQSLSQVPQASLVVVALLIYHVVKNNNLADIMNLHIYNRFEFRASFP